MKRITAGLVTSVLALLLLRAGLRRILRGVGFVAAATVVGMVGSVLLATGLAARARERWARRRRRRARRTSY